LGVEQFEGCESQQFHRDEPAVQLSSIVSEKSFSTFVSMFEKTMATTYDPTEPDRCMAQSVDPDMVLLNNGHGCFATLRNNSRLEGTERSGIVKSLVYTPQRVLSFPSGRATARREALSAADLAADASVEEADLLTHLAGEDSKAADILQASTRRVLYESACASQDRRTIPRSPFLGMRVPGIMDDYYTDVLAWSSSDLIAASLSLGIFIYDVATGKKVALTTKSEAAANKVRSLSWGYGAQKNFLAEGLDSGKVRIRDAVTNKIVYSDEVMSGVEEKGRALHTGRISTCSWSPKGNVLATGSKDNTIGFLDLRSSESPTYAIGHKQEVCGVKWDHDGLLLASGGNDNMLMLWDCRELSRPLAQFSEHRAAVKAISWSPHRRGRLVSGGGTADRTLRFWDANTLTCVGITDAGSQVCNVSWSANVDELVSTHGFSQNHIVIWDTSASTSSNGFIPKPAMPIATLRGHQSRVLYLAVSPDGRTIATAASDQKMLFWRVFPPMNASLNNPLCLSTKRKLRDGPSSKRGEYTLDQNIGDDGQTSFSCIPKVGRAGSIPECSMALR